MCPVASSSCCVVFPTMVDCTHECSPWPILSSKVYMLKLQSPVRWPEVGLSGVGQWALTESVDQSINRFTTEWTSGEAGAALRKSITTVEGVSQQLLFGHSLCLSLPSWPPPVSSFNCCTHVCVYQRPESTGSRDMDWTFKKTQVNVNCFLFKLLFLRILSQWWER